MSDRLNEWQRMVRDFHDAMGLPAYSWPARLAPDQAELRASLSNEEADELDTALIQGNRVEAIDAICDLIYVALGTALEMGIDVAPFFEEVHRSNMAKVGGPRRADGKILKPDGWKPPDIAGVFRELYGEEP